MTRPVALEKILWVRKGEGIAAAGVIPTEADFFKDHFPGFPILPGVLALEMLKQSAEAYLRNLSDEKSAFHLQSLKAVKFVSYLKPGDTWESQLQLLKTKDALTFWRGTLSSEGKVAVSARLVLQTVPLKKMVLVQTT